jgi:protoporphyrinogen oxidase
MDYIIIGGGIAGLYTAYKLCKNNITQPNKILLLEKSDRLGGRILSHKAHTPDNQPNGHLFEMGAGMLHPEHTLILKLISELGLDDLIIHAKSTMPNNPNKLNKYYMDVDTNTVSETGQFKILSVQSLTDLDFPAMLTVLNTILDQARAEPDKLLILKKLSLYNLIKSVFDETCARNANYYYGYDGDFEQNAYDGIIMLNRDTMTEKIFLHGGLEQIIQKLYDWLVQQGASIELNSELVNISKISSENGSSEYTYTCEYRMANSEVSGQTQTRQTNNIIVTIPSEFLAKIPYLTKSKKLVCALSNIYAKNLFRIYMQFPLIDGRVWTEQLKGTVTTKTVIRQIIPMDAKLGLIMIYVAGKTASKLYEQDLQNNLINYILENLRKLFGNIPEPNYTSKKFWENATHVWKPYADSDRISNNILKFSKSDNIYIGGEAFSLHQQWLEGSLDTIENIMKLIKPDKTYKLITATSAATTTSASAPSASAPSASAPPASAPPASAPSASAPSATTATDTSSPVSAAATGKPAVPPIASAPAIGATS